MFLKNVKPKFYRCCQSFTHKVIARITRGCITRELTKIMSCLYPVGNELLVTSKPLILFGQKHNNIFLLFISFTQTIGRKCRVTEYL